MLHSTRQLAGWHPWLTRAGPKSYTVLTCVYYDPPAPIFGLEKSTLSFQAVGCVINSPSFASCPHKCFRQAKSTHLTIEKYIKNSCAPNMPDRQMGRCSAVRLGRKRMAERGSRAETAGCWDYLLSHMFPSVSGTHIFIPSYSCRGASIPSIRFFPFDLRSVAR